MNLKRKMLRVILILSLALLFTGCQAEQTPYEINDAEEYTVSVRYDANGGTFTTNTAVIVDSYRLSGLPVDDSGCGQIALLDPADSRRGNDAFEAVKNGYFLAGWYENRTENQDGTYTYSGLWDFESSRLAVDPEKEYTAAEPVMTLYAAWVPLFQVNFHALDSAELLGSYSYDPSEESPLQLPVLDEASGAMKMYRFPERPGYTYNGTYLDAAGTEKVESEQLHHTGSVHYETGTAEGHVMDVYLDWTEGEWYHIYNVEQFLDNASVSGCYVLHADLDFTGEIWPTSMMYGNFSGTIEGNGHKISNVEITQTNNSKVNAGLFGNLTEEARLSQLTFENITFTIQSGTRVEGTCYGLLAGTVSGDSDITDVQILDSKLQIDSGAYFGASDYAIGLVCGMGNPSVISQWNISCAAVGANPEAIAVSAQDNEVILEFVTN